MSEETRPLIVLMAVHNGSPFVRTAIESILKQTYGHFRFLIIDDASTDETCEIIRSYRDPRIELVRLECNVGQTAALNVGVRRAATPWIARMDADDYAAPTRFEEQMRVLSSDQTLSCVGTFAWHFRDDPGVVEEILERPTNHVKIKQELLWRTPMIHGTIIINRQALLDAGGYDERYRYSADRDLYNRFLTRYRVANIPQPLLGIRRHRHQGSYSLVAAHENVEILTRMLEVPHYTRVERTVVRASLSCSYLSRAKCWRAARRYGLVMQDLGSALKASPMTTLRSLLLYPLTRRLRPALQGLLAGASHVEHQQMSGASEAERG